MMTDDEIAERHRLFTQDRKVNWHVTKMRLDRYALKPETILMIPLSLWIDVRIAYALHRLRVWFGPRTKVSKAVCDGIEANATPALDSEKFANEICVGCKHLRPYDRPKYGVPHKACFRPDGISCDRAGQFVGMPAVSTS